jgi:hypothetical protein
MIETGESGVAFILSAFLGVRSKAPFLWRSCSNVGYLKTWYGARIVIHGLEFFIVVDDLDGNVLINEANVIHRSGNLIFENGHRKHRIVLTWEAAGPGRGVTLAGSP